MVKTNQSRAAKRQIPRKIGGVIFLFDLLMLPFAFLTTKYLSGLMVSLSSMLHWDLEFHHFDTRRYYYYFLCLCILARFVMKGHYSRRVPWLAQVETILKTIIVAALFDAFNYYYLGYHTFPALLTFNWALCVVYLILGRQISHAVVSRAKSWALPVALVGDARMAMDTFYAFSNDGHAGYVIKAILLTDDKGRDFSLDFLPKNYPPVDLYRDVADFDHFIGENRQYYYIFDMDELRGPNKDKFTSAINAAQIEYALIPNTKSLDVYGMEPHYFFGNDVMVLHRRDPIRSPSGRFIKRFLDVCLSALALPFLGAMMAAVYIAKKIDKSDRPVFYDGERVGMNGEVFRCWKFCTMKKDGDKILADLLARDEVRRAEWNKFQKLKCDPRIDSRISAFLRKTSLDEFPQVWNVFRGDMSFVGPRPILPTQREEYGELVQQYYAVRPGITGLWQVSGRNETSFKQRVYWDGWYIRNWSLWYDVVILFKTARVLVTGAGAY